MLEGEFSCKERSLVSVQAKNAMLNNRWIWSSDDGIYGNTIVCSILEKEVSCRKGNAVGSDEELCDGFLDEKLEDCRVGCIEE